jgi:hypothetical protein
MRATDVTMLMIAEKSEDSPGHFFAEIYESPHDLLALVAVVLAEVRWPVLSVDVGTVNEISGEYEIGITGASVDPAESLYDGFKIAHASLQVSADQQSSPGWES